MRAVINSDQFTPFGLWIRQYVRPDISVTNLDYVFEDYRGKQIMLVEEKQHQGTLHKGQRLTFKLLDEILREKCQEFDYGYWGFFLLVFKARTTMPGPGMTLNGVEITVEDLLLHLNFITPICPPMKFR